MAASLRGRFDDEAAALELEHRAVPAPAEAELRALGELDRARRLELGRALVTVPKAHQVPNIERPFAIRLFNITLYEQAEDPKQHLDRLTAA